MTGKKRVLIIAGPNGAGKTTFAQEFLPVDSYVHFVNADFIAYGLSPLNPELAAIRAGRLMLEEIENHVKCGHSFCIETTLSGRSYCQRIRKWQRLSYFVELVFLKLQSVEMAIQRVANRVSEGGHDIPERDIRRRFFAGLKNLKELYKPVVNSWNVYDNSGNVPVLEESSENL
ncbi:MAG: zeta toxin family protein [Planctomycetaceae bacterium]